MVRAEHRDLIKLVLNLADRDFENKESWTESKLNALMQDIDWMNNYTRILRIKVLEEYKNRGLKHEEIPE